MKLKIVNPGMAGHTAEIWIDGEKTDDVISLDLHFDANSFSTCTTTRVVKEMAVGAEISEPPE